MLDGPGWTNLERAQLALGLVGLLFAIPKLWLVTGDLFAAIFSGSHWRRRLSAWWLVVNGWAFMVAFIVFVLNAWIAGQVSSPEPRNVVPFGRVNAADLQSVLRIFAEVTILVATVFALYARTVLGQRRRRG